MTRYGLLKQKAVLTVGGNSQDIDIYTKKKFKVLKTYLEKYSLHGGIVRNDAATDELCICMDNYSDNIKGEEWQVLENVLP